MSANSLATRGLQSFLARVFCRCFMMRQSEIIQTCGKYSAAGRVAAEAFAHTSLLLSSRIPSWSTMSSFDSAQILRWQALADNVAGNVAPRRKQTSFARAVLKVQVANSLLKKQGRLLELSMQKLAMASEFLPECRKILAIPKQSFPDKHVAKFLKMWALQQLAFLPRQKGAQVSKQNSRGHLVANAALKKQQTAFDAMIEMAQRRPCLASSGRSPAPSSSSAVMPTTMHFSASG